MKYLNIKPFLALSLILFQSACSTYVHISSIPEGAEVEINDQSEGTTPLDISLSDFIATEYRVRLKKEGYKDKVATLRKEPKVGAIIGGLFIWPILLWAYGPAPIQNYKLEKESEPMANSLETPSLVQMASINNKSSNYKIHINQKELPIGISEFEPGQNHIQIFDQAGNQIADYPIELSSGHYYELANMF